jgi:NADH:flavin oxidoreductases, Old Yellow Enzyme family
MFQPIQIGKLTIRNRVLSTAHAEVYATDGGMTTDRYVKYYEEKAKGGIGLAICGGSSVVAIDSPQEWWSSVNLSTDRIIPHFQNLADAMHKHGAKIMIQITHMGRRSRWDGFNWPTLMSPSGVREPVHRATCKTIEPEEIWRVIGNYASAAKRAKAGGLDGVELSAVHQHMIDQFWSPRVNKRTDEWGGTFEGRMKFGLEVLKAVRAEVGDDFCVGMRLCGDEFHPDGLSHEDMKQIAKYYDDTGMLDFIGVVGSGCDTHNTLANVIPNMSYPPEPFLHLAAGIKEVVKGSGAARTEHQGPEPGHAHSGRRLCGHGRHDPCAHRRPAPDRQDQDGPDRPDQAVRRCQLLHRPPVPGPGCAVHPERRDLP